MTKTNFDTKYSPIAMPEPFAGSGGKTFPTNTQDDDVQFDYPNGWGESYSSPKGNNGKYVTRKQMNAIGNLATHNDFYRRCGGLNTFDIPFAHAIGGYPKGAVLDYISAGKLFKIQSLVDNNLVNPSAVAGTGEFKDVIAGNVDDVNWMFLNQDVPSTDSEYFVGNITGASEKSSWSLDDNLLVLHASITILNVFQAKRSGMLAIENVLYSYRQVYNNIGSNLFKTMCVYGGNGIIYKDLGPNASALESIITPNYEGTNGWKLLYGPGSGSIGFSWVIGTGDSWRLNQSSTIVAEGNYYAIALFVGVGSSTYSPSGGFYTASYYDTVVEGKENEENPISFDLYIR